MIILFHLGFPCGSAGKESACSAGDLGSIPWLGRPPGEGKGYPLQCSRLKNSMDCIVYGVTKSLTWLSTFHFISFSIVSSRVIHVIAYMKMSFLLWLNNIPLYSYCSVAKLYPTLCNPMDCSMPGFPILHCLPEFAQTHVHCVDDAIQPSHPLLFPSPAALSLSQHQDLFQRVSSSHQVAKVLELQLQHQSFQWIFSTDFP